MSGLVGRGQISYRKRNVAESNIPAIGIKAIKFFHIGRSGDTGITFGTLRNSNVDSSLAEPFVNGHINPANIARLTLGQFRNNVRITSNLNGELIDFVTYDITDDALTFLNSYSVDDDEIFEIAFDRGAVTGNRIVDARPLRSSGTLLSNTFDFPVGQFFKIASDNMLSNGTGRQQIGNVQVFVNGILMARNVGNADEDTADAASQTGNYREINSIDISSTTANAIRFNNPNVFSGDASVVVISTNLIVDNPESTTVLDQVEAVTAQAGTNTAAIATNTTAIGNIVGTLLQVNEVLNSATITVPDGAVACRVTASGGGGGGGQGGNSNGIAISNANGGNAGEASVEVFSVGIGGDITTTTIAVVIGPGGAGATGNSFSNAATNSIEKTAGTATSLTSGSFVRTWAGGNIDRPINNVNNGRPVTNRIGPDGQTVNSNTNNNTYAGGGGSNSFFFGGNGSSNYADSSGNRLGGGGGGGAGYFVGGDAPSQENTAPQDGGDGGDGGMLIEWYAAITSN